MAKGYALNQQSVLNAMQKRNIESIRKLARISGVCEDTLYKALKSKRRVYSGTLLRLARALGVPADNLIAKER